MSGAEDFSYFSAAHPGCFVFIGGGDESTTGTNILHQASYNYNDKVTPIAMALWVRVVEARFGVRVLSDEHYFPPLPAVEPAAIAAFVKQRTG